MTKSRLPLLLFPPLILLLYPLLPSNFLFLFFFLFLPSSPFVFPLKSFVQCIQKFDMIIYLHLTLVFYFLIFLIIPLLICYLTDPSVHRFVRVLTNVIHPYLFPFVPLQLLFSRFTCTYIYTRVSMYAHVPVRNSVLSARALLEELYMYKYIIRRKYNVALEIRLNIVLSSQRLLPLNLLFAHFSSL